MKTIKMTRVSFSDKRNIINVQLPTAWEQLSQVELLGVYSILVNFTGITPGHIQVLLFKFLSGVEVVRASDNSFFCMFPTASRLRGCDVSAAMMTELLEPLDFMLSPGAVPVRLEEWAGIKAQDAELHGVSFGAYLELENLFQGYVSSQSHEAMIRMAMILYPGIKAKQVSDVLSFSVFQWLVQVKNLFRKSFPNFFRPVQGVVTDTSMLDIMNNEIRALTGGDIAKEDAIFSSDCWRALTELDFKAKEAEELNRQLSKHKS